MWVQYHYKSIKCDKNSEKMTVHGVIRPFMEYLLTLLRNYDKVSELDVGRLIEKARVDNI